MDQEGPYDSAFLGILQNEGRITNFLDSIFGFLYRRTDFFLIMKDKEGKFGFPPGVALKQCIAAFKKYEELAKKDAAWKEKEFQKQFPKASLEPVKADDSKSSQASAEALSDKQQKSNGDKDKSINSETSESASPSMPVDAPDAGAVQPSTSQVPEVPPELKGTNEETKEVGMDETSEEKDDNPELTKLQKVFQANPDSYNGAIRDKYVWSQSITDCDIKVKVPKHVQKGKDVQVVIERKHLKVAYLAENREWVTVIDDELNWDVNKLESMWSIEPGKQIAISLEKVQERWWEAVLKSEPHISVRKIDPSRPMTDLDDEAQAKIEEMMYNEHQKRLGLPQSHEKKVHNMLQNAWDAEGSPFKGQKFDPSMFNVSPGNSF